MNSTNVSAPNMSNEGEEGVVVENKEFPQPKVFRDISRAHMLRIFNEWLKLCNQNQTGVCDYMENGKRVEGIQLSSSKLHIRADLIPKNILDEIKNLGYTIGSFNCNLSDHKYVISYN